MNIGITGATKQLGRLVVRQFIDRPTTSLKESMKELLG
jgi:hypothetical protein